MTTTPSADTFAPLPSTLASIFSLDESALDSTHYRPLLIFDLGLYLMVPDYQLDDVRRANFDKKAQNFSEAPSILAQHILLFAPHAADFRVRLLAPSIAHNHDPPIESTIPAFSAYLREQGLRELEEYGFAAERGDQSQRQSIIHVEIKSKKGGRFAGGEWRL